MKKIIALVIIIALAVAGYQVYKDDNKRMVLEEKIKNILYSIDSDILAGGNFYDPTIMKKRSDLQPSVDEFVKKYYNKEIEFILKDGTNFKGRIKNIIAVEYTQDNDPYKKGDIVLLGVFEIEYFKSNFLPAQIFATSSNEPLDLGRISTKNGNIVNEDLKIIGKTDPFYIALGSVLGSISNIVLADEISQYSSNNSLKVKYLLSGELLKKTINTSITDKEVQTTIEVRYKFSNKPIYVKSYFQHKDNKFYEIKRESNVKEYIK